MANWNDMPIEIKMMIIEQMKFETRTKLKWCSNWDRLLVNRFPMKLEYVCLHNYSHDEWTFVSSEDGTVLSIGKDAENQLKIQMFESTKTISYSTEEEAERIVDSYNTSIMFMLFNCPSVEIKYFQTSMLFPPELLASTNRPRCEEMEMKSPDILNWLRHFDIKMLEAFECCFDNGKIVDPEFMAMAMGYKEFITEAASNIDDNMLLNFTGSFLAIGKTIVTSNGVNLFIKQVIGRGNVNFSGFSFKLDKALWNIILDGIDCTLERAEDGDVMFKHVTAEGQDWFIEYDDNNTFELSNDIDGKFN